MEYCDDCKVNISTKTNICPLCHKKIKIEKDAIDTFPAYEPLKNIYTKTATIISLIAPFLIVVSLFLNLFIIKTSYWSVIAIVGIIYLWLLGLITFNRKIRIQTKIIAHAITIPLVLVAINAFASNELIIERVTWAISYAVPLIIFCFIAFINFIMIRTKQNFREYLLYQFTLCLIGFVPLIILLFGVAKPIFPSLVTAIYSFWTIFNLIFYSKDIVKEEFKKRFHV